MIGEVIAINGVKITLRVFDESSKDTIFYNGEKHKGISIREYISIQRGFRDIVCIIEGEYLDENRYESNSQNKIIYIRKIDVKPIGYYEQGKFNEGIKFLPMIKDLAFLLPEIKIAEIYSRESSNDFIIGKMLKEEISISLPWQKLFNSHIGIFGNTGSGKSNTLAKLYTVLFQIKKEQIKNKSKFVLLDFNGEYISEQLIDSKNKKIIQLNTQLSKSDKFILPEKEFWDVETLSILFQATTNTQRPFLNRVIDKRSKDIKEELSLNDYLKNTIETIFTVASPKSATLDLIRTIAHKLNNEKLVDILKNIAWHSKHSCFYIYIPENTYFNSDGTTYKSVLSNIVDEININELDSFDELIMRCNLQLIKDLILGYVQFDHIQPLLQRIESSLSSIKKVINIDDNKNNDQKLLTIISLRNCNQEIKKILPLLITKYFYHEHKALVKAPPDKTMHLIIDEAHNILSQESTREHESWKDYRLELFEEIIKEGRKFGMFITLSSQRPADISPTIMSQLHNFFIHRLVNDRDLYLLDNTISTLDSFSRSLIPNLAKGSCIVTGTSFDLPMVLQIDRLEKDKQPDSEDVDLEKLWC